METSIYERGHLKSGLLKMVISIVKNLFEVLTNENEIEISSVLNSTPKILS